MSGWTIASADRIVGDRRRTGVIDNLKAAVTQADWYDPELNPKIRSFCEHYGIAILPTKPRTLRHKGKIEGGVGYAQNDALKGRTFGSLAEQNRYLQDWETHIADKWIHGTTCQQVGKVFAEIERAALLPLPAGRLWQPSGCGFAGAATAGFCPTAHRASDISLRMVRPHGPGSCSYPCSSVNSCGTLLVPQAFVGKSGPSGIGSYGFRQRLKLVRNGGRCWDPAKIISVLLRQLFNPSLPE